MHLALHVLKQFFPCLHLANERFADLGRMEPGDHFLQCLKKVIGLDIHPRRLVGAPCKYDKVGFDRLVPAFHICHNSVTDQRCNAWRIANVSYFRRDYLRTFLGRPIEQVGVEIRVPARALLGP